MNDVASRRNARSTRIADSTTKARSPIHGSTTRPYSPLVKVERLIAWERPSTATMPAQNLLIAARRPAPASASRSAMRASRRPTRAMPTAVANQNAAVATTSSSGSGPVEAGRPVSGERSSGKSVTWSRANADTPSPDNQASTQSDRGGQARRGGDHAEGRPVESGHVPEGCRGGRHIGRDEKEGDARRARRALAAMHEAETEDTEHA